MLRLPPHHLRHENDWILPLLVYGDVHLLMPVLHRCMHHMPVPHVVVQRQLPDRVRAQWLHLPYVPPRYPYALLFPHVIAVHHLS